MNSAYMCYYQHLAKLALVANKQTMFLAHMLYHMEWESEAKQMVVHLNPRVKRSIMQEVARGSKDANRLANQYLQKLTKAGLIKGLGGGSYLVDPLSYGGHKYIGKQLRINSAKIYETRVFTEESEGVVESYIVTEDGERIDL